MDNTLAIPIPSEMPEEQIRLLREDLAVHLYQRGHLSAREAAEWLQTDYESFVTLAARQGAHALRYDAQSAHREMERLGTPIP